MIYHSFNDAFKQTMHNSKLIIRPSNLSDLTEMQEMFVDTISTICKHDYSPEQIIVWTSSIENTKRWTDKLSSQYFLIAELNNKIVGFASLQNKNYFDLLYVHKDFQRQGIASRLYTEIENEAIKRESTILSSDVSKTARQFFEKKGFQIIAPQIVVIKHVELVNYKMSKLLS